jgi:hypothetical protein
VIVEVSCTFIATPIRPKWSLRVIAEAIDDEAPNTAGHMCRCGRGLTKRARNHAARSLTSELMLRSSSRKRSSGSPHH